MKKLSPGAFTGNAEEGNPYSGDLSKGIDYDRYEANCPIIFQDGGFPKVLNCYRAGAREVARHYNNNTGTNLLDLGSGTGISTLELHKPRTGARITGIEISEGMLQIAEYKFHKRDRTTLPEVDEKIESYWSDFRKETKDNSHNVNFILGDFQTIDLPEASYDGALASQFMHWTDLNKSFSQLQRFLRTEASVIWSSASHFYNDKNFPAAEFGFRYNDFFKYVLEDVCREGDFDAQDPSTLSVPPHNWDSINSITEDNGFHTLQVATYLKKVDFQVFVQNHIPIFVKQLIREKEGRIEQPFNLDKVIAQAIGRQIVNPKAMGDTKHKYDIAPIFKSVKKK